MNTTNNMELTKSLIENAIRMNDWNISWDKDLKHSLQIELLAHKVVPGDVAGYLSTKAIAEIVHTWECNTERNYHEQMKALKMKDYKDERVYTMQNKDGDYGFIQWIDKKCNYYAEVSGDSGEMNPDFFHNYIVIAQEEYEIIRDLHWLWQETEDNSYFDMIEKMIDLTYERNKHRLF